MGFHQEMETWQRADAERERGQILDDWVTKYTAKGDKRLVESYKTSAKNLRGFIPTMRGKHSRRDKGSLSEAADRLDAIAERIRT